MILSLWQFYVVSRPFPVTNGKPENAALQRKHGRAKLDGAQR
jgi:hypothetical protein